jgi:hypothetical protein
MGGKGARRSAQAAADASRAEAQTLREQTSLLQQTTQRQAERAQRILMRSLRARGTGIFETDFTPAGLGGAGVLG